MATHLTHEGINIQIPVGKEIWTIGSDRYNFILGRKTYKKGRKDKADGYDWDAGTTSFYSSLESVLRNAQKIMLKNADIRTFGDLQMKIKETTDHLLGMYKEITDEDFKNL